MESSYDTNETQNDNENQQKPRRLDEESAFYLTQIESQFSDENIKNIDESDRDILVNNVLTEIKQRIGSAMSDRRTNMVLENICYNASFKQLLDVINAIQPYSVFLARNRHSSHCLQAIFSRLCFILKNVGISANIDEDAVKTAILSFCQPLLNEICWLSQDLNASHVIRAMICLLTGIPTIAERKVS